MTLGKLSDPAVVRYNQALDHPSLRMAATYLRAVGIPYSGSRLADAIGRSDGFPGVAIGDLIQSFSEAGVALRAGSVSFEELCAIDFPVLVYMRDGDHGPVRPVVISKIGRRRVAILNDRIGISYASLENFRRYWCGIIMVAAWDQKATPMMLLEIEAFRQRIHLHRHFLSKAECAELIAHCEESGFKSSRVGHSNDGGRIVRRVRSSASAYLRYAAHPLLYKVCEQCVAIEATDGVVIENVQCVRYRPGQKFRPHFDSSATVPRRTTYLIYLNDDFEGGETHFPIVDLAIRPEAGMCLQFPSCEDDGRVQWLSEHGGMPISQGTKYALNVWVQLPP